MTLRHPNDNGSSLPEGGTSAAIGGLKRKKQGKIGTILSMLSICDNGNMVSIAAALNDCLNDSSVVSAATSYFEHLRRGLAQTFTLPNGTVLDNKNVILGPYYCIKYCTENEWTSIMEGSGGEISGDKLEGICYTFPDHLPLICFPNPHPSTIVLKHEIRHAKDHYIMALQPETDREIVAEILGYLAGTKSTQAGRLALLQSTNNPYGITVQDSIFISEIFDNLEKLDFVNLDLLSITPLRKWPKLLKNGVMDRLTHDLSSNVRLIRDYEYNSFREWAANNGFNPGNITGSLNIGYNIIWDDIYLFCNIHTIVFFSGGIEGDVSEKIKKMKNLKTVKLKRRVYNNISKDFLEKTPISFIILDE